LPTESTTTPTSDAKSTTPAAATSSELKVLAQLAAQYKIMPWELSYK
jgi:hypothetical protein